MPIDQTVDASMSSRTVVMVTGIDELVTMTDDDAGDNGDLPHPIGAEGKEMGGWVGGARLIITYI